MIFKSILSGCTAFNRIKNSDLAFFCIQPADFPETSKFCMYRAPNSHAYDLSVNWAGLGMAYAMYPGTTAGVVLTLSQDGKIAEIIPSTGDERETEIPFSYSDFTAIANIGNAIWVSGMDRVVLKREADGRWTDYSAPSAKIEEGIIGFTGLAELPENGVVAVGWAGEIWIRQNNKWLKQESGSNANFNAVSVGHDGTAIVVGDNGAIVSGRQDQWSVLDSGNSSNLQGVCHCNEEIFVCSDFEIFRLKDGTLEPETRFAGDDKPDTCMNLLPASNGAVYSQGERDIFRYFDGVWRRII